MENETNHLTIKRKYPIGAEIINDEINFRIWAPSNKYAELLIEHPYFKSIEMQPEENGYFSADIEKINEKILYRFGFPNHTATFADPASRFQPQGPKGPSQVIDTALFQWTDSQWQGVISENQIIYEMHIGTFTSEGTWLAATAELKELANLGVTIIELMPIADFLGDFGWGYDGIFLFAPCRLYGPTDDLLNFIDTAHKYKLAVILDVVFNHLGPGNFIENFSNNYFSSRNCEWGKAINFDGPDSEHVREFIISNALYWIKEYHFDGFRIDATQQIYDTSAKNIMTEIIDDCRQAAVERNLYIIGENEPQDIKLFNYGFDSLWNDDFHHSMIVALTGKNEAYYSDYTGTAAELLSAVKYGFIYQGQFSKWQQQRRGTWSKHLEKFKFICYLQNHDQVANSGFGLRINKLVSPSKNRAALAFLILGPWTPLIFQGQEFNACTPFLYFANASPTIDEDRKKFLDQFPTLNKQEIKNIMANPADEATFMKSKLNLDERFLHNKFYNLFKDLIKLKKTDELFSLQGLCDVDGDVLNDSALILRFLTKENGRLLIVNFGKTINCSPASQTLFAPYNQCQWELIFSTEAPEYGGGGLPPIESEEGWYIPAECAIVFRTGKKIEYEKNNSQIKF